LLLQGAAAVDQANLASRLLLITPEVAVGLAVLELVAGFLLLLELITP